jgi:hypothetical protein
MNLTTFLPGWLRRGRWLGLLTMVVAPSAGAVTQEIKALFTPDSGNPQRNEFINKTTPSGYCANYPGQCLENNMFSIRLPLRFESARAIQPIDVSRNSAMFHVPAQWRALTVTNKETNETETVEVRIAGFGSQYGLSDTAKKLTGAPSDLEGHQNLWGGPGHSWVYAPHPCVYSGVGAYLPDRYAFFWKTPVDSACVKTALFQIPSMSYNYLDFAYELRTPKPLEMSSGLYTGDIRYRVGPGGDFDMGDVMLPVDSDITLSFVLDVQHTLKVDIPPGGNQVQLVPAGGWQGWLQAGRKPVRLFRDQTFTISASSKFKMQLECEISAPSYECMILDPVTGRAVELRVSTSLPNGLTDLAGQPVKHLRLRTGAANAPQFQPGFYVDRAPGVLHFEVPADQMGFMLSPGKPGHYSGKVTVIWDSEA